MLDGDAPIVISSQLLNRQDGKDEYHDSSQVDGRERPTRARRSAFAERVLEPRLHYAREDRMMLGYQCANSRMTIAVAADHWIETDDEVETILREDEDLTKMVFRVEATRGQHHPPGQGRGLPLLARRAGPGALRPLRPHPRPGGPARRRALPRASSASGSTTSGTPATSQVDGPTAPEQRPAGRPAGDPLQPVHASPRPAPAPTSRACRPRASPARATRATTSGTPRSTSRRSSPTRSPDAARNLLHFRTRMLPAARHRAREMAQSGALFPWRTINGEEASAYYAAGTAQVHIDADIAYALVQYVAATGDLGFLVRDGHRHPRRDRPGCGPTSGSGAATAATRRSTSTA